MKINIMLIGGEPMIHADGCRDIERHRHRDDHDGRWVVEVDSWDALAVEYACDFLDEGSMTLQDAVQWVKSGAKPCVHLPEESPMEATR